MNFGQGSWKATDRQGVGPGSTPVPARPSAAPKAPTLLQVTRDPQHYALLRALVNEQVCRLTFPGSLSHFTYDVDGDEVLASDAQVALVCAAVARAIGRKQLRPTARRLRGLEGQETLVLPAKAKQGLLLELLALAANLSASDLAHLPPPVDVQAAGK